MEIMVDFPGGARVDAHFGSHTVMTDQPRVDGTPGSAPTPFELFLSSIATCAGIYALNYCRQHNLPTEGLRIVQHVHANPANGMADQIEIEIQTPAGFPEKHLPSLIRAAELCKVKKHLQTPPEFRVYTRNLSGSGTQA